MLVLTKSNEKIFNRFKYSGQVGIPLEIPLELQGRVAYYFKYYHTYI
jgi:hypothetical protein